MAKRKMRVRKVEEGASNHGIDYDEGLLWMQEVQIRPRSQRKPMARFSRWKNYLSRGNVSKKIIHSTPSTPSTNNSVPNTPQHNGNPSLNFSPSRCASNTPPNTPQNNCSNSPGSIRKGRFVNFNDDDEFVEEMERKQFTVTKIKKRSTFLEYLGNKSESDSGLSPNKMFIAYVNWTFIAGFFMVFFSFLLVFFFLNFVFGVFLKFAGDAQPGCIVVSGEDFGFNPDTTLADAFALSWTTFTTVGYGMIYTSTGTDHDDQKSCSMVVFLCTAESFIGLLYAGMCAAILFGKVSRIQSAAQVIFSNSLCVQYGKKHTEDDITQEVEVGKSKCPLLKFQIVNELSNSGNPIMDAMLKVLSSNNSSASASSAVARYMKIELMEFENPFFSRVWQGRHILNEKSPLLKPFVKERIRENGGFWPVEWNCPEKIHDCLDFSDFVVTIVGIADVTASTVHAYKRYVFEDVVVGYDYAPLLYKNTEAGRLKVDMTLIQDVIEDAYVKALPIRPSANRLVNKSTSNSFVDVDDLEHLDPDKKTHLSGFPSLKVDTSSK